MIKDNIEYIVAFLILCASIILVFQYDKNPYENIKTYTELDSLAEFSFVIMGNNQGESYESCQYFKRMNEQMAESGVSFVIGTGNHVKSGSRNSFLKMVYSDKWWQNHFYPNTAEKETEYWGKPADSKNKIYPFYNFFAFKNSPETIFSSDAGIYYTRIKIKKYQVHLFQVSTHVLDSLSVGTHPLKFVTDNLKTLYKSEKDIVILASPLDSRQWMALLSKKDKNLIYKMADLIISDQQKGFTETKDSKNEDSGPLIVDAGSVCYPDYRTFNGYIQVHFFSKPSSFIVQYIDVLKPVRELQTPEFAYLKYQNGKSVPMNFRIDRRLYQGNGQIVQLDKSVSEEELNYLLNEKMKKIHGADFSFLKVTNAPTQREINSNDLMEMFPDNQRIMLLSINIDILKTIMDEYTINPPKDEYQVILNYHDSKQLITKYNLSSDQYRFTDYTELTAMEYSLKNLLSTELQETK